jgi:hypothetical protein
MAKGKITRRGVYIPPSSGEVEAMDSVYEVLSSGAVSNGERFEDPDDDWLAVWLVATKDQATLITGDAHKYDMVEYVAQFARRIGAIVVGHLHSSWVVLAADLGSPEEVDRVMEQMRRNEGSTEGIEQRKEIIMLGVYGARAARLYTAAIHRDGVHPPRLDDFALVSDSTDGSDFNLDGAMVDPLREALTHVG